MKNDEPISLWPLTFEEAIKIAMAYRTTDADCPMCSGRGRPLGSNRNGSKRFQCRKCNKCFSEVVYDGRAVSAKDKETVISMLLGGKSIRQTAREVGINVNTVTRIGKEAGIEAVRKKVLTGTGKPVKSELPSHKRIVENDKVRRFATICVYNNPLTHGQIYALVSQVWPEYSNSGLAVMLSRDCENTFKRTGEKYYSNMLPHYWDKHNPEQIRDLTKEVFHRLDVDEFKALGERKPVARKNPACAICAGRLEGRQRKYCDKCFASLPPKSSPIPLLDATTSVRVKFYAEDHDELTTLAFSIAASFSELKLADLLGPVWIGLRDAHDSGVRDHEKLTAMAKQYVKDHWRSVSDYATGSLDSMKETIGFEPSDDSEQEDLDGD